MSLDRPSRIHLTNTDRDMLLPDINLGEVLRGIFQKLIRRWQLMIGFVALCTLLAIVYVTTATPVYTANGSILIDPRVGSSPNDGAQMIPGLLLSDALTVDSELRVLISREVTAGALRALNVKADDTSSKPWTQRLTDWIGIRKSQDTNGALSKQVLDERNAEARRRAFVRGLKVERAGDSFVLDISYTSADVEFASLAVNTLMQEYLRLSSAQQIMRAEQTRNWLSERIAELGRGVETTETAVAAFRQENQLLVPAGTLLPTEMALNAANAEMVRLRALAIATDVQAQQLTEQIDAGQIDAIQISPEDQTNALIEFRARYTALMQQEGEMLLLWDQTAPLVIEHREKISQARDLIIAELIQSTERLRARGAQLRQQIIAISTVISELQGQYGQETTKTVQLRSLEREANAKRVLYEQLLDQYNSTSQLLTFDSTPGRVIAWAVAPDTKSAPKSAQILILAAFAGFLVSVMVIFLIESLDTSFRVPQEISEQLRMPFIGLFPNFRTDRNSLGGPGRFERSERWRKLSRIAQRFDFSANSPISVSAETARSIHVSLKMQKAAPGSHGLVVGMLSSVRGEGKTTTAFNIATYLARQNERVVLVDLDLISRELSRQISPLLPSTNSLTNFLVNPSTAFEHLDGIAEFPGLAVIGSLEKHPEQPSATRDAVKLKDALTYLRQHFDFVIVDLPPLQGAADTQLLSRLCDRFILVIRWGHTPKQQIISALRKCGLGEDKFLGAVLTQAKLHDYRSYNPNEVVTYYS